jgi:hypothetical protein
MKPKQLFLPGVRLLTTKDLIIESPDETTTFVAVRVEDRGDRLAVSIEKETVKGWNLPFRDVVFDRHGTIEAAVHVLRRSFCWEKATEIEGVTVWRLRTKLCGLVDFELFLITNWEIWNAAGVRRKERNSLAEELFGKRQVDATRLHCERIGLRYLVRRSQTKYSNKIPVLLFG